MNTKNTSTYYEYYWIPRILKPQVAFSWIFLGNSRLPSKPKVYQIVPKTLTIVNAELDMRQYFQRQRVNLLLPRRKTLQHLRQHDSTVSKHFMPHKQILAMIFT